MYNTEIQIVEESIRVKFDDKLESEKSKLVHKFADLEISYPNSEDKSYKDAQQEVEPSEPKVVDTSKSLRKFKQRSLHLEDLIRQCTNVA